MAESAWTGPLVSFGAAVQQSTSNTNPTEYNGQQGPSFSYFGWSLLDQRPFYSYKPGQGISTPIYGWAPAGNIPVIDQVPGTLSTIALSTGQQITAGTALLQLTASTLAVTVNQSVVNAITGATDTGLLAIDTKMAPLTFGSDATVNMWNPAKTVSRCITITTIAASSLADDSGMYWAIAGYDVYGYPVSERIAGSSVTSSQATFFYTSQKAYKYIKSITPVNSTGTIVSTTAKAGISDTFGFPLLVQQYPYFTAYMDTVKLSSVSTFVAGSTTTATSTTADVRGTIASSIASDGSKRLIVFQSIRAANINADGMAGVTGVTQFSS